MNFQMFKLDFEKAEEPEIKLPNPSLKPNVSVSLAPKDPATEKTPLLVADLLTPNSGIP